MYKNINGVKGFKVFDPDWTCRGFQFEVGQTYEKDVTPEAWGSGFYFCKQAKDCFNYYGFNPDNKVAEVVALGDISEEGYKCSTNKIKILRKITWTELLVLTNAGKGNVNLCNSGNYNNGTCNNGDWNSGARNSGDYNSGNWNSGNFNSGDWNSGNFNSGYWNIGDWNRSCFNVGCFNTEHHKIKFFDKETDMTLSEWSGSDACYLLSRINLRPTEWVSEEDMSDEEKKQYPEYKATGGYLKKRDTKDACIEWWDGLSKTEKDIIRSIPNFNPYKFYDITGIIA